MGVWCAAVVTVSDGVSAGTRVDESGPAVGGLLEGAGFEVEHHVVADDRDDIERLLRELAARAALVVTTGGTGFAPRDVTPEATRAVIEREAPVSPRPCARPAGPRRLSPTCLARWRASPGAR
jgi:molybdenum cofactor synthesis domain-containing protein